MEYLKKPIPELQAEFWNALRAKDPRLFHGTPGPQYYDLTFPQLGPLKIRLDIYFIKRDYVKKGYIGFCLMFHNNKAIKNILQIFKKEQVINSELRPVLVYNHDEKYDLNNPDNWDRAIEWFTQKIHETIDQL